MRSLTLLGDIYSVCRLAPDAPIPDWVRSTTFFSITRNDDELSIVCPEAAVPLDTRAEHGWRCFKVAGPIPFDEVGVVASLTTPLAAAAVGVFVISTFDTDYILIAARNADAATAAWRQAGFTVTT